GIDARLKNGTLPSTVAVAEVKKKPQLFLKRMPPPQPADVELAEKLLAALESRHDEANGFPWTMKGLLAHAAANADPKVLKKVLGSKQVKSRLVVTAKGDDAPVALSEESDRLMTSPAVLTFALTATRTDSNQAATDGDLVKKVSKPLQRPFALSLGERVVRHNLPPGIGLLVIKKKPYFFFLADAVTPAVGVAPTPAPVPLPRPPVAFAASFEQA